MPLDHAVQGFGLIDAPFLRQPTDFPVEADRRYRGPPLPRVAAPEIIVGQFVPNGRIADNIERHAVAAKATGFTVPEIEDAVYRVPIDHPMQDAFIVWIIQRVDCVAMRAITIAGICSGSEFRGMASPVAFYKLPGLRVVNMVMPHCTQSQ